MRVAGLMSGTSLDGVDAAVIDIKESRRGALTFDVVAFSTMSYPEEVRRALLAVSNQSAHVSELSRLNFLLPDLYAKALRRTKVPLPTIELVGSHGQTIFHERKSTLQIGDGSVLAELVGVPVVSDFRPRDMAAGGRGAPLVPFVDYLIYRNDKLGRVALNVGGIANITAIPAGGTSEQVIAFDTGPGNMIIDQLVSLHTRGKKKFDDGGRIAKQGSVDRKLLDALMRKPYYKQSPPKTAGREQYGHDFVQDLLQTGLSLPDLIATATAFTAATISVGVRRFVPFKTDELIVSGGGVHNSTLLAYLQGFLPDVTLRHSSEFGVDCDAKEAIAFAILAYQTWTKRPGNLPSATGAKHPVILGKISL